MSQEEQVIMKFRDLYNKIAWVNRQALEDRFKNFTFSEMGCIEFIGDHRDANVTKLADHLYMTRGALSKMTRKLIGKGLIESYQKPTNKKEIYFKLTAAGQEIYATHEKMHRLFIERDKVVFKEVTPTGFNEMLEFLATYNTHLDNEIKAIGHQDGEV